MDMLSLKKTLLLLLEVIKKSKTRIEKYINMQDPMQDVYFDISEKTKNEACVMAKSFSARLVNDLDTADRFAAILASNILKADDEMQNEITKTLSSTLDAYILWQSSAKGFVSFSEKCLSEDTPKFSALLSESRRLEAVTDLLSSTLEKTITSLKL